MLDRRRRTDRGYHERRQADHGPSPRAFARAQHRLSHHYVETRRVKSRYDLTDGHERHQRPLEMPQRLGESTCPPRRLPRTQNSSLLLASDEVKVIGLERRRWLCAECRYTVGATDLRAASKTQEQGQTAWTSGMSVRRMMSWRYRTEEEVNRSNSIGRRRRRKLPEWRDRDSNELDSGGFRSVVGRPSRKPRVPSALMLALRSGCGPEPWFQFDSQTTRQPA